MTFAVLSAVGTWPDATVMSDGRAEGRRFYQKVWSGGDEMAPMDKWIAKQDLQDLFCRNI